MKLKEHAVKQSSLEANSHYDCTAETALWHAGHDANERVIMGKQIQKERFSKNHLNSTR